MKKVDLFLGSDLGAWVLENVSLTHTGWVISPDASLANIAREMGHKVFFGDIHEMLYDTSDVGLLVHYPKILKDNIFRKYRKLYNLHPSYLPWGRGYFPVFWALWEDTPAGATLHEITTGLDKGPIVIQKHVKYSEEDTGYTLFQRVREAEKKIFLSVWGQLQQGAILPTTQQRGKGTYHSKSEFLALRDSFKWQGKTAEELLKLIRCLSFPGHPGMKVIFSEKAFELNLRLIDL